MKKLLLILYIIFPMFILSQDLDEAYLESLPDNVREDVLGEMKKQKEDDKPVYRRPTTMVERQKSLSERLAEVKQTLNELTYEFDENSIEIEADKKPQKRYGSTIFNLMQSSFMPINEPNFDGSYILDFGDVLEIQVLGQRSDLSRAKEVQINRDGSVNIPDIGKVFVSGLSLDSASKLIKNKIDSIFIGTESFISLVNIRDIQVLISGNATNPGIYTLNGNSNLLHALSMAGGINELGSYRDVRVIRDGEVISKLDLYDIFILGKPNYGPKLRSGDSIFIERAKILVNVVSGVNRPHVYELKSNENFSHAINFANDFKSTANLNYITVQRLENGEIKFIDLTEDALSELTVNDRDIINVREYVFGSVTIKGAVNSPGEYSISPGTRLSEIINAAGGYKSTAYPLGGFLNNKKTKEINKDARDILYTQYIKNLANNLSTLSSESQGLSILMSELKKSAISGRVMAEFYLDAIASNPDLDTLLEDQDEILIPFQTQQVYVYGEISNQGAVRYKPGEDINYYLRNAGSILETGDKSSVFVVHPNGKTERLSRGNRLLIKDDDILIFPGSIIYVPNSANLLDSTQTAAIWAPIISSIALSLTSLSVLNND
jgi:protein involved in polysaccharide export with SLBB domain